jgi:hypothetical protein
MAGSITKVMGNAFSRPLNSLVKSKFYEKRVKDKINLKTFDNAVALLTLGSIVVKDGLGCIMYVEQSKHNKRIPEERRNFVWKLDAVNGGLMIAFQILFFLGMRKFNDKLFGKLFKSFKPQHIESVNEARRVADKAANKVPRTKNELNAEVLTAKSAGLSIFRSVSELVASTILAKRVVVPFIATYLTDKLESKHNNKNGVQPAMTGTKPQEESKEQTPEIGSKLDVTSTQSGTTNLLEKYKQQNA